MNQFILGTMRLDMENEQSALELLQKGKTLGIEYLDTADIYGGYKMNAFLGRVLQQDASLTKHYKIIGKTGIRSDKQDGTTFKHYDYSGDYIKSAVEQMCREFGIDQLEYLLLHRPSPLMNYAVIGKTLTQLQNEGVVKQVGVSNFNMEEIIALNQYAEVTTNQIEFSPLCYEHYDNNVLTYLQTHKLGAQIWSPLAGGKVFEDSPLLKTLEKYARQFQVSVEAIIYAFIHKLPVETAIILGTTKKERLDVVLELEQFELPLEAWFDIAASSQKYIVK